MLYYIFLIAVSESMAAFLTAEMLTCQSASESQIEAAMRDAQLRQRAYNTSHPQPKGMPAIAIPMSSPHANDNPANSLH